MPGIFSIFSSVCLPLLALVGAGYFMDRKFGLDLGSLVKLNIYLFVPSFILVKLSTSTVPGRTGLLVMIFTACVIAAMAFFSWVAAKAGRYPPHERAGLQLVTMIYNSGNWGIPLVSLAFPNEGGVIQVFVLAAMNLTTFSVGVFLANASHGGRTGFWNQLTAVFRQPSIYAILLALILRFWGNPLREVVFLWAPLNYVADGLVGFALLTLGIQLSQTRPPRPAGRLGWALAIRLLGGPLAAFFLTRLFGFSGTLAAILIVGAASPTAVNTALIAHEFGTDSRFAAAAVYYSTLAATLVVTLLLAAIRRGWIG